jgi:hypothetical protein
MCNLFGSLIIVLILAKECIKTSCVNKCKENLLEKISKNDEIIIKTIDLNRQKWL